MTHGGHVAVVHQPHRLTRQAGIPREAVRSPEGPVARAPSVERHAVAIDHDSEHMLRARHVDTLDPICVDISGDAAHRAFGQGECLTDRLERFRVEPAQGRVTLPVEAEVLREQRAVAQGQEAVVAAVDERALFLDVEVIWVETVQIRAVDGVDGSVCMGEDRPAPDVISARQPR